MLDAVFSFRGRIGRLQYFMASLGLGVGVAIAVVLAIVIAMGRGGVSAAAGGSPPLALVGLLLLVVAPVGMWIGFSLQARRFRDIGWNPAYVIPGWLGFSLVDQLVAHFVPSLSAAPLHDVTIVGGLVNVVMAGSLIFWPGRSQESAPPSPEVFWPKPDSPPPMPASPVRGPAPVARPAPISPGFGRRGL